MSHHKAPTPSRHKASKRRHLARALGLLFCFHRQPWRSQHRCLTDGIVPDEKRASTPAAPATPTSTSIPIEAGQKQRKTPHHLTLMGLPRELRDMILAQVFAGNGDSYVKCQLLGFPAPGYSTYSTLFRVLLTCQQLYAEGFPLAYRSTCFYWFRNYSTGTLDRLCSRLNDSQAKNVRHIALWSNPYLYEDFMEDTPVSITIEHITVCSNYMSGEIPVTTVHGRLQWILKNIRKLQTLKSFHFLTGCSIVPGDKTSDCDFAKHIRDMSKEKDMFLGSELEGVEVGSFDPKTSIAKVKVPPSVEGGRVRIVDLKVASVFEGSYGGP